MSAMKRNGIALALAIAVGLPAGWILAFMATPILWRLEPVLKMELAGHSGPSDWVFYVVWVLLIPGLFWVFRKTIGKSLVASQSSLRDSEHLSESYPSALKRWAIGSRPSGLAGRCTVITHA